MRRKIFLTIGNKQADIDEQTFILFNYAQADLTNPTLLKNAVSQQITLPATPANNRIFGHIYRPDRRTQPNFPNYVGIYFDPLYRTPYHIEDEAGATIQSGYLKLDRVTRRRNGATAYECTLYGGLGSFLYGLSYSAQGEKLSLADLDFLGTGTPATELDFTIEGLAVSTAWAELALDEGSRTGIWSVINFAPCYNGVPANFAANKGLATPGTGSLDPDVWDVDGNQFLPDSSGYVVVNFPQGHTEWDCKDLRSYLQRPVVSVKKILAAIADPDNNGGYSVDLSDIDTAAEFPWQDMWLTLPLLPDLGSYKQVGGDVTLAINNSARPPFNEGQWCLGSYDLTFSEPIAAGTIVNAMLNVAFRMRYPSKDVDYLLMSAGEQFTYWQTRNSFAFVQAVGYDGNGTAVASSAVDMFGEIPRTLGATVEDIADALNFQPIYGGATELQNGQIFTGNDYIKWNAVDDGYFQSADLHFDIQGPEIEEIRIMCYPYTFEQTFDGLTPTETTPLAHSDARVSLWEEYDDGAYPSPTLGRITEVAPGSSASFSLSPRIRSGARITKQILLSGTPSPAEFLVSFCRMFGLSLEVDSYRKTVAILRRNTFFQNTVEDLTKRIDTRTVAIRPVAVEAKWYDFEQPSVGGAFAEQYASVQGRPYGIQRVNTGWDFDANHVDVLQGTSFRSCAAVLESGQYWYTFTAGADYWPPVFLDPGATATYYGAYGKTYAVDVGGIPTGVTATPLNAVNPGYDLHRSPRAQFHDGDGKPLDGSNVLLLYKGQEAMPYFKITDDDVAMDRLVSNPCWLLDAGTPGGVDVPLFSRYDVDQATGTIGLALDFGMPAELDIPSVLYDDNAAIYPRSWKQYIGDLYDRDTKIMTCKVDLRGYQVGPELLRRFWWYDGSIWVLNKITNHSLTTWDLTECEFVQVQDIDNYINGQI